MISLICSNVILKSFLIKKEWMLNLKSLSIFFKVRYLPDEFAKYSIIYNVYRWWPGDQILLRNLTMNIQIGMESIQNEPTRVDSGTDPNSGSPGFKTTFNHKTVLSRNQLALTPLLTYSVNMIGIWKNEVMIEGYLTVL